MPQFAPNEEKVAIATFPVKPTGLACTAELWLSRDGVTKDATSGEIPFISTGVDQSISLPIIMPSNGGLPYQVLLDPKAEGISLPGFRAIEDVVIAAAVVSEWSYTNLRCSSPGKYNYSYHGTYDIECDVTNVGNIEETRTIQFWTFRETTYRWEITNEVEITLKPGETYHYHFQGGSCGWTGYPAQDMITAFVTDNTCEKLYIDGQLRTDCPCKGDMSDFCGFKCGWD